MTLNGVMAVTLRYFTEFGKHMFQHITAGSICVRIYIVFCSTCTMSLGLERYRQRHWYRYYRY